MLNCMTLPWSNRCESRDLLASSSYIEEFIAAVHVSLTTAKEFVGAVICCLIFFCVFELKEFKRTQLDFCFVDLWHYREAEEWRIHWRLWLRTLSKSPFCSVLTSLWLALLQMNQFLNFGYSFPEQILGACISGHLFCCQSGSLHQGAPWRLDWSSLWLCRLLMLLMLSSWIGFLTTCSNKDLWVFLHSYEFTI